MKDKDEDKGKGMKRPVCPKCSACACDECLEEGGGRCRLCGYCPDIDDGVGILQGETTPTIHFQLTTDCERCGKEISWTKRFCAECYEEVLREYRELEESSYELDNRPGSGIPKGN